MQVTYLVGNGFDIAAGIDTSYRAFYKWYLEQPSDKENIKEFKRTIKEDIDNGGKNWSDFELGLGKYTKRFNVNNVSDFLDCYDDAQKMIVKFLKEQTEMFDTDNIDAQILSKFKIGFSYFYREASPQEVSEVDKCIRKYNGKIEVQFLSFNYTNTLDKVLAKVAGTTIDNGIKGLAPRAVEINPYVIHMHGTLTHYPVIGVNDESQISNPYLLNATNFSDIMIKSKTINEVGHSSYTQATSIILNSQIVCVFGMSLGHTDMIWWQKIIEWLNKTSGTHLIIYWYTRSQVDKVSTLNWLKMKKEIKDIVFERLMISDDIKNKIENRIHIIINTEQVLQIPLKRKLGITIDEEGNTL